MAIVTLDELKKQVRYSDDDEDTLMSSKIDAAQGHIERILGFSIEEKYPDETPAPLKEAVLQLAAWWFEQREAAAFGAPQHVPFSVLSIVAEYRDWSFGYVEA